MTARPLTEAEIAFWQDYAEMSHAVYMVPRHVAKVDAFMFMQDGPVTLDEIAAGVNIAKSAASAATATLVRRGFIRRVPLPGTKRAAYVAVEAAIIERFTDLATHLRMRAERFAKGLEAVRSETVRRRVALVQEAYELHFDAVTELVEKLRERALTSIEPDSAPATAPGEGSRPMGRAENGSRASVPE
jgi:DNA-binding MarR family transcriptional regulator